MGETNNSLWAPWRMAYIRGLPATGKPSGCFLCEYVAHPEQDAANHIIWRTETTLTLFNRFPYSNGHLLIAPRLHAASLAELPEPVLLDLMRHARDAQILLKHVTSAHGFNLGMNFGRCAGAGLPDHLHLHIVPRWEGDTNFMPVCADTRVIPESIESLYEQMKRAAVELGLPPVGA